MLPTTLDTPYALIPSYMIVDNHSRQPFIYPKLFLSDNLISIFEREQHSELPIVPFFRTITHFYHSNGTTFDFDASNNYISIRSHQYDEFLHQENVPFEHFVSRHSDLMKRLNRPTWKSYIYDELAFYISKDEAAGFDNIIKTVNIISHP